MSVHTDDKRHHALRSILGSLTLTGLIITAGFVAWILAASLRPTQATILSHQIDIDLSGLKPGEILRVQWGTSEVVILHRTPEQIAWIASYTPPALAPYLADEIPAERFRNRYRSYSPEYLVVSVLKNSNKWLIHENRNLVYRCDDFRYSPDPVPVSKEIIFPGAFYCASKLYGNDDYIGSPFVFDPAGRTQSPWYQPLRVPPHLFIGKLLVLGLN